MEAPVSVTTMVLPSTVVRLLHRDYPRDFKRVLGADTNKLRDFWTNFLSRLGGTTQGGAMCVHLQWSY